MRIRGLTGSRIEEVTFDPVLEEYPGPGGGKYLIKHDGANRAQMRQVLRIGKRAPAKMAIPKGRRRRSR